MKLQRLASMGVGELAERGRQQLSRRFERFAWGARDEDPMQRLRDRLAEPPSLTTISSRQRGGDGSICAGTLLERFREESSARFFLGTADASVPTCLDGDKVLARAEALCRGRFDLLGYRNLSFGDPVDWHLDPISGRRAPRAHWSRLDHLDAARVGDHKVIWELNRHQWLVCLGQAYRLTGDERYAAAFAGYVRDWMRSNPPGLGINWVSSLEASFRLIAWSWALVLFQHSPALSPELYVQMLSHVEAHASHVRRYLSTYFSPNTHLLGEALGLFYAGTLFRELRASAEWRAIGQRILEEESARQILDDGVHFELSTWYQRYTVEIYLHFLILASRNGVPVEPRPVGRVARMLDFLLTVRRPDGSMPQIGDADGGYLLPLAARDPDDLRGVFAVAAAFFGRTDYAWAADGAAPETAWLLGGKGVRAFDALTPVPPTRALSSVFAESGYVVMRSGWGERDHQIIFDAGPLGCPVSAGHGHADLLSIQCSFWGSPYLVDPGTLTYRADLPWRNALRGTASHSTVTVDGEGQAAPVGPFAWESRPRASLRQWSSTEATDLADGAHDAYARLSDPVRHRRRVIWIKARCCVLVDDLDGQAEHEFALRFQFAPIDVTLDPSLWARARDARGHGLLVRPFASASLKAELRTGELDPVQGWVSTDYGRREAAPILIYSTVVSLPVRVVTLLWPIEDGAAAPPYVRPIVDEASALVGLALGDGTLVVLWPDGVPR